MQVRIVSLDRFSNFEYPKPLFWLMGIFGWCADPLISPYGRSTRPVLHFDFSLAGNATDHKVGQEATEPWQVQWLDVSFISSGQEGAIRSSEYSY